MYWRSNPWKLVCIRPNFHGHLSLYSPIHRNTLRPRQNGHHFADDISKRIFLNQYVRNSIKISLKFVPKGPINNIPALVQIMAWRRSGDKPLSEPMMDSLLTHICVSRPQWVNRKTHLVHMWLHYNYTLPRASKYFLTITLDYFLWMHVFLFIVRLI